MRRCARAVWVYVDLDTGAPLSLPPSFFEVYGEEVRDAQGQRPAAAPRAAGRTRSAGRGRVRVTDFDVFGHVNNAVYWSAVEDELAEWLDGRRIGHCEIEFRAGIDPGDVPELLVDAGDELDALVHGRRRGAGVRPASRPWPARDAS